MTKLFLTSLIVLCLSFSLSTANLTKVEGEHPVSISTTHNESVDPTQNLPFELKDSVPDLSYLKIEEVPITKIVTAWLIQSMDVPVISVRIALRDGGDKSDPKDKQGLVNLFLAMLDDGAADKDAHAFKRYLLEHNIEMETDNNIDTTFISLRFPASRKEEGFHVLKLLLNPAPFSKDQLEKIKSQMKVGYTQSKENERVILHEVISQIITGGTIYERGVKKNLEHLPHIKVEDFALFHQKHVTQDKIIFSVCGQITPQDLKNLILPCVEALPEKSMIEFPKIIPLNNLGTRKNVFIDVPQTNVVFVHPFVSRMDPDYYALDVALQIFGDGGDFNTRLMQTIRVKEGLTYGAGATAHLCDHTNMMLGSVATRQDTSEKVVELVKAEWKKLRDQGITQRELDEVRKKIITSFALRFSSTGNIASVLSSLIYYNLGKDFLTRRQKIYEKLTLNQVNSVIKKHFTTENLTFFVGGRGGERSKG